MGQTKFVLFEIVMSSYKWLPNQQRQRCSSHFVRPEGKKDSAFLCLNPYPSSKLALSNNNLANKLLCTTSILYSLITKNRLSSPSLNGYIISLNILINPSCSPFHSLQEFFSAGEVNNYNSIHCTR